MRALILTALILSFVPTLATAGDADARVDITNVGFADASSGLPATLIAPGQTIEWTNRAGIHTVSALDGSFASDTLRSGDTYAHTFTDEGVVPYRCSIHLNMYGLVVVDA